MSRLYRISAFAIATIAALSTQELAHAAGDTPVSFPPSVLLSRESLLQTDQATLEELYRSAGAGSLPFGPLDGLATASPGTRRGMRQSKRIGILWKGKEFPGNGTMVNRLAFGMKAVHADMYYGESFLDGRPSIVLDYANTSRLFGNVRDEMRELAPGVYLGMTYIRKCPGPKLVMFYVVQTPPCCGNDIATGKRR